VLEYALADKPHTFLWLAMMCVISAVMCGRVCGTRFLQAGNRSALLAGDTLACCLRLHFSEGHVKCEAVFDYLLGCTPRL